jgi:hypothetical protein
MFWRDRIRDGVSQDVLKFWYVNVFEPIGIIILKKPFVSIVAIALAAHSAACPKEADRL